MIDMVTYTSLFEDIRLRLCADSFQEFEKGLSSGQSVSLVYHADTDGVVAAAYLREYLSLHNPQVDIVPYWVGTDEYDFGELEAWISAIRPNHCVFVDVAIENNSAALSRIAKLIPGASFIFDHHIVTTTEVPPGVTLANPTPRPLSGDETPVPSFLFAECLSRLSLSTEVPWLVLLCFFSEGVDEFFPGIVATLNETVFGKSRGDSPRTQYRKSSLSRIAALIKAGFTTNERQHETLNLLGSVARGETKSATEFRHALEKCFAEAADAISRKISTNVDRWKQKLSSICEPCALVDIEIPDGVHVIAPIASILRGHSPQHVILTSTVKNDLLIVEARTGNRSQLNLVKALADVAEHVILLNHGGHPPAAGAKLHAKDKEKFIKYLRHALFGSR